MTLAQLRRDDHLGHITAHDLAGRVAERALGSGVEIDHVALVIHGHHAVEGGVQHCPVAGLLRPQRLPVPAPLDCLADLVPKVRHRAEQLRVELAGLAGEELDHPECSGRTPDGKAERRVQPGPSSGLRPGEVWVSRDVRDPCRLIAAPYAARQALTRGERRLPARSLEFLGVNVGCVPDLHASEGLWATRRRSPLAPKPPIEILGYRLQRADHRVPRVVRLGQAPGYGTLRPWRADDQGLIMTPCGRLCRVFRYRTAAASASADRSAFATNPRAPHSAPLAP